MDGVPGTRWSANEERHVMSGQFLLRDFLGRVSAHLLGAYCERRGILGGFDWGPAKKADAEAVAHALEAAGSNAFERATVDFRAVWDLHGRGFTLGLLNEAKFRDDQQAISTLQKLSHLDKAFWAVMERPAWAANAKILSDVDKLPAGAWIKRNGLPARPGPVERPMVDELEAALIDFFMTREFRGRNCKIEALRREEEEIFFTWAEDHPDSDLLWENGHLRPQTLSRSFTLVFKHRDRHRSLDIYLEGDRGLVPELQVIFSRTILGEELPEVDANEEEPYSIERILEPGFRFAFSPESGIADVRMTKMRFRVEGAPWRRFTAEADTARDRDALDTFVERLRSGLAKSSPLVLDQVCLQVTFSL